jgi:hypothetical protein
MSKLFQNWKTTLAGVLSIVLLTLTNTGVLTPEATEVIDQSGNSILNHIDGIIAGVLSIGLLFSKDGDKDNNEDLKQ